MSPPYRADIDALRGIAVAAVVAFHAFPQLLPGGFIGVDVFFVISGYLITGIVARDLEAGRFGLWRFYRRRVNRILPALLVVLAACLAAGGWLLLSGEYRSLGVHAAGASVFASNFVLLSEAGYFDEAAHAKPLLHLWSLGIEEQFYIAWPLALWLALRLRRSAVRLAAALALLSFAAGVVIVSLDKAAAFYHPLLRAWELLAGGLLAVVEARRSAPAAALRRLPPGVTAAAGVAVLVPMLWLDSQSLFPGAWALLPALGTAAIIASGPAAGLNRWLGGTRVLVGIGLISYPLYLWHWPLLSFARIVAGATPAWTLRLALVALSVGLAWLTWRYVERPVRSSPQRSAKSWALVASLAGAGGVGLALAQGDGLPERSAVAAYEAKSRDLRGPPASGRGLPCPGADLAEAPTLHYCLLSRHGPPTAALLGDSHADQLFEGVVRRDPGRTWLLVGHPSTPPLLDVRTRMGGDDGDRQARAGKAIGHVAASPTVRTVVVAFFGNSYLVDDSVAPAFDRGVGRTNASMDSTLWPGLAKEALIYRGLGRTIEVLRGAGKEVVLFAGVPELAFLPKDCIGRPGSSLFERRCELSRTAAEVRRARFITLLHRLAAEHPGVRVFDPFDSLCDAERCRFDSAARLYYRDWHHLSVPGSEHVVEAMLEWLSRPAGPFASGR